MVTSMTRPNPVSTYLTAGQRFHAADIFSAGGSQELTVHRLVRDEIGLLHVVLRDDDGREISTFAEQIELTIELGALVPVNYNMSGLAS
ncbi:MAG TPA: hypothetical protein VNZ58_10390 [Thermomicrobiales bacterium]|nr:hypothetical protein [Thermomicrobiales bacterium]